MYEQLKQMSCKADILSATQQTWSLIDKKNSVHSSKDSTEMITLFHLFLIHQKKMPLITFFCASQNQNDEVKYLNQYPQTEVLHFFPKW